MDSTEWFTWPKILKTGYIINHPIIYKFLPNIWVKLVGHISNRVLLVPVDIRGTLLVDTRPYGCFIISVVHENSLAIVNLCNKSFEQSKKIPVKKVTFKRIIEELLILLLLYIVGKEAGVRILSKICWGAARPCTAIHIHIPESP